MNENDENKFDFKNFQAKWPNMFKNVYCGFGLPKGWGPIVWDLCEHLEYLGCEQEFQDEDGNMTGCLHVDQVKEKFGGLRFYFGSYPDKIDLSHMSEWDRDCEKVSKRIDDAVEFVEGMSFKVCDQCATTADITTEGGWRVTRCKTCRAEWEKRYE